MRVIDYKDIRVGDLIEITELREVKTTGRVGYKGRGFPGFDFTGNVPSWEPDGGASSAPVYWLIDRPAKPLTVGNIVNQDDNEPPEGVVLRSPYGIVAVREAGRWHVAQGGRTYSWHGLTVNESAQWAVVHTPE